MSIPRAATRIGSRPWIATLATLNAMVALSIDMSLPAQTRLAAQFAVPDETAQLTLSLFIVGFAATQIFVGYLADAFGRRPVLLAGLSLFVLAGIACALSPTIELLLIARVVQGAGAAAAPVIARAMVRDTHPAGQGARLLAMMLAALAVAPMIAPMIGGVLLQWVGWRAIFATLVVVGVVMLALAHATLAETLPARPPSTRPSLGGLASSYRRFFATPGTRLPLLLQCATFAGQFGYIADSPFVLMGGYGVSELAYALYFGATALALMIGSITGGRMLRAGRSPGAMTVIGTAIVATGGALVIAGTHADLGIAGFVGPMLMYFFGVGLGSPSATALAMEPVPEIAGTASAALGCATALAGALAGYATTKIGGTSPTTFGLVAGVLGACAFAAAIAASVRRRRALSSHHVVAP